MLFFIPALIISISLVFASLSQPVSLIATMIIQTLLVALMSSLWQKTFWFGYILFLVFLGGMLVLFSYITTLASNEMFKFSAKALIMLLLALSFFTMYFYMNNSFVENHMILSPNMTISKFYSQNYIMTMFVIMYLLITLFVVVKISSFKQGPLRS